MKHDFTPLSDPRSALRRILPGDRRKPARALVVGFTKPLCKRGETTTAIPLLESPNVTGRVRVRLRNGSAGDIPPVASAGQTSSGLPRRSSRPAVGQASEVWCGRRDSNPHTLASASPSSWGNTQADATRRALHGRILITRDHKRAPATTFVALIRTGPRVGVSGDLKPPALRRSTRPAPRFDLFRVGHSVLRRLRLSSTPCRRPSVTMVLRTHLVNAICPSSPP